MASPCELLIETDEKAIAHSLTLLAQQEALRIECKFSRYRHDNVLALINQSNSKPVSIDEETYRLLTFANTCYELSDGKFDITAGVLRKIWQFDGSDKVPAAADVKHLLPFIGWQQVQLNEQSITLPSEFELDLGGIGKEYATDKVASLIQQQAKGFSVVVNFGGDIRVTQPRKNNQPWYIGIENPLDEKTGTTMVRIHQGGLATSGDSQRFLLKEGKRYSHILNPFTGFPIENPPRSVTVAAEQCTQAGLLATLSLLQGENAETFLQQQNVTHWIYR
ncbi:MAG: FAD:protein FMN transferase [Gammaproteobacteria bacterium]|nr:FAD:protein FMN transferase [Gammaproteobacteria bacterium]